MADCENIKFYSPKDTYGGEVPEERCYATEYAVPEELREPTDIIELEPQYVPDPIIIGNDQLQKSCPEGTYSDKNSLIIIPKNKFTEELLIQNVYDIPEEVIIYIAKNKLEEKLGDYLNNALLLQLNEAMLSSFILFSKFTRETALQVIDLVKQYKDNLNKAAELEALVELDCYITNDYTEAICPGIIIRGTLQEDKTDADREEAKTNLSNYSQKDGAISRAIVSVGTFKQSYEDGQTTSIQQIKDTLNIMAQQEALAQLNCLYENDPTTVTCLDEGRPGRPREWELKENQPLEEVKTFTDGEWRDWLINTGNQLNNVERPIGRATVGKGMFTSSESKDEANAQAKEYAYTLLNCIYLNEYQQAECDDPNARFLDVSPRTTPQYKAKAPLKGQIVYVLDGFYVSEINTKYANEEALELAKSLLECCFVNKPIEEVCEEYIELDGSGNETGVRIPASYISDPSQSIAVYVPEGMFTSCNSQEEADYEARQYADSLLEECYYCNQTVLPSCVPPWVLTAVQTGVFVETAFTDELNNISYSPDGENNLYKLPLPLDYKNIYNPITGKKEDVSRWSVDATTGYPDHSVCVRRQEVIYLDDLVTSITPTLEVEKEVCTYENDPVVAGCRLRDPYDYLGDSYKHIFISKFPPYEEDKPETHEWCITDHLSNPQTDGYIEIPAGTFRASEYDLPRSEHKETDENGKVISSWYPILPGEPGYEYGMNIDLVKDYVNQQAIDMAESMLECVFSNPLTIATCTAIEESELCTDMWRFKDPTFKPVPNRSLHEASNTEDNPIIIPADTFTSYVSQREVREQTKAFAQSLLQCFYGNKEQKCDCVELGKPHTTNSVIKIPENTFMGPDPKALDQQAKDLACSLVPCFKLQQGPPGPQGPPGAPGAAGAPGKDGSPGGCAGTCHGIYC